MTIPYINLYNFSIIKFVDILNISNTREIPIIQYLNFLSLNLTCIKCSLKWYFRNTVLKTESHVRLRSTTPTYHLRQLQNPTSTFSSVDQFLNSLFSCFSVYTLLCFSGTLSSIITILPYHNVCVRYIILIFHSRFVCIVQ